MGYAVLVIVLMVFCPDGPARPRRSPVQAGRQARPRPAAGRRRAARGRAMSAVLSVRDLKKHLRRHRRRRRRVVRGQRGRNPRHHRAERQRKIDAVQLHPRPAAAERRRSAARRPAGHRHAAVRSQPARREPHLPAAADFPAIDRARKPDPRGPGAQGHHALAPVRPARRRALPRRPNGCSTSSGSAIWPTSRRAA